MRCAVRMEKPSMPITPEIYITQTGIHVIDVNT